MNEFLELWERPEADQVHMIAGWRQWADAGDTSSGFPQYLIEHTGARKIGEIKPDGFYVFQIPGTHDFLRPQVKLEDGYRVSLEQKRNEIFFTGDRQNGLVIFLGDEPHLHSEIYADAFLDIVRQLGVKRTAIVGGVYGPTPHDKDRSISCTYSLQSMKEELVQYSVRFSNYEGGASIGSYFADRAQLADIELFSFYAFVPAYDFSEQTDAVQGIAIEKDFRAWYELLRRFNHMFGMSIDLSELRRLSDDLVAALDLKIEELEGKIPGLNVREYVAKMSPDFAESPFMPLDDIWAEELGDIFDEEE